MHMKMQGGEAPPLVISPPTIHPPHTHTHHHQLASTLFRVCLSSSRASCWLRLGGPCGREKLHIFPLHLQKHFCMPKTNTTCPYSIYYLELSQTGEMSFVKPCKKKKRQVTSENILTMLQTVFCLLKFGSALEL